MATYPWTNHYEEGVPATIEIPTMPLSHVLSNAARQYPDQTATHLLLKYLPLGLAIRSKMTYRQVDEASTRFAVGLQKLGVRKGDRVAIMLPNLPQSVVVFFGILKAGGIVVNTNPIYTPRELEHQLQDSGAETIILLSGFYDRLQQIRAHTAIKHVIVTDIPDTLSWPFKSLAAKQLRASGLMKDLPTAPDLHPYHTIASTVGSLVPVTIEPEDVALFQYTGGTTGLAKAAMLTNHNLVSNVHQVKAWFVKAEPGREKVLAAIPFFHVYGMTVAMLYALLNGAELIIVPDPRNTAHILQIIDHEKVTLYPGIPAMYIGLNNHPKVKEYNLHSIKACLSGASALPVEVANQFEAITGGRLVEGYGMTECSPVASANPIYGRRKIGSVGLPIPNTEVAVVTLTPDAAGNYAFLPQGEEGELVIRGPQVMKGYWNRPEETAKDIDADGWLHTGDIGKMDEEGYFYIVDRKKDLIIASGYNIVPREVEEVLYMYEKVMEATVAGIPDAKRGECVKAYVVLKKDQKAEVEEIRTFCKQHLAAYKVPTFVEFREELPKSQAGKILRRVLVEEEKQKQKQRA
ncbi:MAG: long-chain fatty acid--CoA ligase [Caldilineaceae bacterium]|nr:long-chain fatty acid--CoA ligase [Caldilineaceae bacterium]